MRLPDDELAVLCNFLLGAGHDTTANLSSGSIRYLLEKRELKEQLGTSRNGTSSVEHALGANEADLCGNIFGRQGRQLGQQMAVLREAFRDWNVAGEIRKVPLGISEI